MKNILASLIQAVRSIFHSPSNESSPLIKDVESTSSINDGDWMKRPGQIVYLLQQGESEFYKIGFTSDSTRRYKKLDTNGPEPLREIHRIYTEHPEWLEKKLHDRFADKRRIGSGTIKPSEWFSLTSAEIEEFKSYPDWDKPELLSTQLVLPVEHDAIESNESDAIERVDQYFDKLIREHPSRAKKLEKARKYQVEHFEAEVIAWERRGLSREDAIGKWEARANGSGKAKIDR